MLKPRKPEIVPINDHIGLIDDNHEAAGCRRWRIWLQETQRMILTMNGSDILSIFCLPGGLLQDLPS